MKTSKRLLTSQRRTLDARLRKWAALRDEPAPRQGWSRAVRESLGLTQRQLAARLGSTLRNVQQLEEREVTKAVSLASLEKLARAMSCRVVYAVVPEGPEATLEEIVEARALRLARALVGKAGRTMALEDRAVSDERTRVQVESLAGELARSLDARLWEEPK